MTRLMTMKEAAVFLGISYSYFRRMVAEKQDVPPYYRYGERVFRFSEKDLLAWLEKHKEEAGCSEESTSCHQAIQAQG